MRKCIKEINNYRANNPFIQREPLKQKIMRSLFLIYKKGRIFTSKWYPLADWQKNIWLNNDNMVFGRVTNAAAVCIKGKENNSKHPFFNIKHFSIMELIPKEQMDDVMKGIRKFRSKHSRSSIFDNRGSNAEYFKDFLDGDAFSQLGTISIKENSRLRKYISQIDFRAINLTSSFCCLNIVVQLNEQLVKDISSYVVSNVPGKETITGYKNKKWYQFRTLGRGTLSGSIYKNKTLEMVLMDIKWNILNELSKCITTLVFKSQSINAPSTCSILTNIDGNSNTQFWKSMNIDPRFCDFYNDMSACIAWREDNPFFLYTNIRNDTITDITNEILSHHIGDELCSYMIASFVDLSIRSKLKKYSCDISKLKKKNIRHWLKSKVKFDMEVFYEARFMSEYKHTIKDGDFDDFFSLRSNRKPIILYLYSNIEGRIEATKNLYNGIVKLYQSNLDYRNAKTNHKTQRQALVSSIVSAFVAIVAIIISIISNESAIKTITSWWNWLKNIFI